MKKISLSRTTLLKIAVATLIVVLVVSVVYLVKYRSNPNNEEEQSFPPSSSPLGDWAPILEVGDSWKLALTIGESEYNLTITVTDEETVHDVSCYVMNLTFEPENPKAETGISNEMTSWLDKSTFNIVKLKGKGRAEGHDFIYTEKHSYTFQGGETSLTVGTEYNQTDTKTINVDVHFGLGVWYQGYIHDKSTTTNWIKVEVVENVTVPAGTFSCYKIVTYDETGRTLLSTRWFSMEIKTAVKSVNHETGEESGLLSYSI